MKREIPTSKLLYKELEWPPTYPTNSLKCFMICIVSTFRKTKGNDGTVLQRIIVYCGSRYLVAAADCLCRERLGEREHFTSILLIFQEINKEKFP
jgi:hypothetical protein